jgi:protein disulfide-isomerase A1
LCANQGGIVVFGQLTWPTCRMKEGDVVDEKSIEAFARGIVAGTVQPDRKSEEIPEDDMEGNVKIIVGNTWEKIARDPKKDVFVFLHAPWCAHCKNLEPTWRKLATRFKDIDSVVIAKMDGTANDQTDVEVDGFPFLVFLKAEEGHKGTAPRNAIYLPRREFVTLVEWRCHTCSQGCHGAGLIYTGERTLKSMTKFIKRHAVIPYELRKKSSESTEATDSADAKDEL